MFSTYLKKKAIIASKIFTKHYATSLKDVLKEKIPGERQRITEFRKKYAKQKVCDVVVNQLYKGMRGIKCMVWETSLLDANDGIKFRGHTVRELKQKLPKALKGEEPLPEGLFWLLMTSEIPNDDQVKSISIEWAQRSVLPNHVTTMLQNFPITMHPMTQLSCAVAALNHDSKYAEAYQRGVKKSEYWHYAYEDSMDLIAKLPVVAARIYRRVYKNENVAVAVEKDKDWAYNFCTMLGYNKATFIELMRLYLTIHSDHEGGNVSAHTTHLVASALSDPFLSFSAGLNGLAGPLHGLANQEVLIWIKKVKDKFGDKLNDENLKEYIEHTIKSGRVVPGYGHAVLRKTDPRYMCQKEFAEKHLPDDPLYKIVSKLYKIVPPILQATGKVENPWPNVDAHSGVLLSHYGMTEMKYYTVLFGVSRSLGVLASLIWARALGFAMERPKSTSTNDLIKMFNVQVIHNFFV